MVDEQKVQNFVTKMHWVHGIPHAWSRADELGVLIGEAKKNPEIAREACKRVRGGVSNQILKALPPIESE